MPRLETPGHPMVCEFGVILIMEPSQQPETAVQPEPMPLAARLFNVFTEPGEVFKSINREKPCPMSWGIPLMATILAAVLYSFVVFSQPPIVQRMLNIQQQALQKNVEKGKTTQLAADRVNTMMRSYSKYIPIIFSVIITISAVVVFFLEALVLFLVARFAFHAQVGYAQLLEVAGLASMINVLSYIFMMGIAVGFGDTLATPGPVLLVGPIDSQNAFHLFLSQLNVLKIWEMAVAALGVARVSNTSWGKAAAWLFGIWGLLVVVPTVLKSLT
jgi:hypothetical protein